MGKKTKCEESPVQPYKGKFICRAGGRYRVKNDPNDSYSVHHGSFDSSEDAKGFVDEMGKAGIKLN